MTWLPATAPGPTPFDRVLGLCPELHADLVAFTDLLWTCGVDPVLLELCRLRVAQLLGSAGEQARHSPPARAAGLSAEKIAALEQWRGGAAFSARERACLELAEQFVLNPRGVADADVAAVAAHLSAAETVAVVEALAVFDGFTRFRVILAVDGGG
jgi:alkylhydroperoxidase family enzyme